MLLYLREPFGGSGVIAFLLAGAAFGLVTLCSRELDVWRSLTIIAASGLINLGAHTAAAVEVWPSSIAFALPGATAAFVLSVLYVRLARGISDWKSNLRAAAFGGFAGLVIAAGVDSGEMMLIHSSMFAGYALWQAGFAVVHEVTPRWWPVRPAGGALER
jgi:hypothetical protein